MAVEEEAGELASCSTFRLKGIAYFIFDVKKLNFIILLIIIY